MDFEKQYTPTAEEMDKAKEQMTSTEKDLTSDREAMMEALEKAGQTGYIELIQGEGTGKIVGAINGASLELNSPNYADSKLDGCSLPEDVAKRLFVQYQNIAIDSKKVETVKNVGKKNQEALDKAESLFMYRV